MYTGGHRCSIVCRAWQVRSGISNRIGGRPQSQLPDKAGAEQGRGRKRLGKTSTSTRLAPVAAR